jgi:LPS-assembly protein
VAATSAAKPAPAPSGAVRIQAPSATAAAQAVGAQPAPATPATPATAAADGEQPVQLTADQITYDRELGIVTARGRVEIIQEGRMLVADQVSYNLKQDIVSASGNVALAEPKGETLYSDYFELTGDLKEGVASQIRSILADNSRMTATRAQRVAGNRTDFEDGTYTACEPCRKNPNKTPLWQAKAKRITHNQDEQVIEYRDAWMELAGVPVLYTPYLSHPDPSVKRQSGFLTPTGGASSNIGTNVSIPYFWAIKDNQDLTFAPRFLLPGSTSKRTGQIEEGDDVLRHVVLAGEHRWHGAEGEERTIASLTQDKYNGDLRGHINSRARFDLNSSWRAGYQLERASDDTYNRIYGYHMDNDRPWMTTRPYLEGFGRRGYSRVEAFAYQGTRETDAVTRSPLVLPHVTTSQLSVPDAKGGYYTYDADMLSYARSAGTDSTRISNTVGWHRPYMGSFGDVTTISTTLRADAYHSEEVADIGSANAGRAIPTVSANWRMPFARPSQTFPQIIEPVAMVAASPNGGNTPKIPNEDSIGFELDETSVFRPNRLPGLDRVEGGVRGAYGLRWHAYPGTNSWITAMLAQGWRAHDDSTFGQGSGFDSTLSDYLGRLDFSPSPNISLLNRVRLDKDTGDLRRNENTLSVGSPILRADVSYVMYQRVEDQVAAFDRQHAVVWELSSALTRYWSVRGGVSYNLNDNGGPTNWNGRLIYNDECLAFITDMRRDYTYDRDYLAGYALTFNVVFKTLGSVPFNVF